MKIKVDEDFTLNVVEDDKSNVKIEILDDTQAEDQRTLVGVQPVKAEWNFDENIKKEPEFLHELNSIKIETNTKSSDNGVQKIKEERSLVQVELGTSEKIKEEIADVPTIDLTDSEDCVPVSVTPVEVQTQSLPEKNSWDYEKSGETSRTNQKLTADSPGNPSSNLHQSQKNVTCEENNNYNLSVVNKEPHPFLKVRADLQKKANFYIQKSGDCNAVLVPLTKDSAVGIPARSEIPTTESIVRKKGSSTSEESNIQEKISLVKKNDSRVISMPKPDITQLFLYAPSKPSHMDKSPIQLQTNATQKTNECAHTCISSSSSSEKKRARQDKTSPNGAKEKEMNSSSGKNRCKHQRKSPLKGLGSKKESTKTVEQIIAENSFENQFVLNGTMKTVRSRKKPKTSARNHRNQKSTRAPKGMKSSEQTLKNIEKLINQKSSSPTESVSSSTPCPDAKADHNKRIVKLLKSLLREECQEEKEKIARTLNSLLNEDDSDGEETVQNLATDKKASLDEQSENNEAVPSIPPGPEQLGKELNHNQETSKTNKEVSKLPDDVQRRTNLKLCTENGVRLMLNEVAIRNIPVTKSSKDIRNEPKGVRQTVIVQNPPETTCKKAPSSDDLKARSSLEKRSTDLNNPGTGNTIPLVSRLQDKSSSQGAGPKISKSQDHRRVDNLKARSSLEKRSADLNNPGTENTISPVCRLQDKSLRQGAVPKISKSQDHRRVMSEISKQFPVGKKESGSNRGKRHSNGHFSKLNGSMNKPVPPRRRSSENLNQQSPMGVVSQIPQNLSANQRPNLGRNVVRVDFNGMAQNYQNFPNSNENQARSNQNERAKTSSLQPTISDFYVRNNKSGQSQAHRDFVAEASTAQKNQTGPRKRPNSHENQRLNHSAPKRVFENEARPGVSSSHPNDLSRCGVGARSRPPLDVRDQRGNVSTRPDLSSPGMKRRNSEGQFGNQNGGLDGNGGFRPTPAVNYLATLQEYFNTLLNPGFGPALAPVLGPQHPFNIFASQFCQQRYGGRGQQNGRWN